MGNYKVTVSLNEVYEIEANSENEAIDKAHDIFKKEYHAVIPSEFEVEEMDDDE